MGSTEKIHSITARVPHNFLQGRNNNKDITQMYKKPIIALDLSSTGKGGGPYVNTMRIFNSELNEKYEFKIFIYRTEMGRLVSIRRIMDLVRQLKKIRPDIVHFSGLQLAGFHIAVACKIAGIKNTIVTIHGSSSEALNINWVKKSIVVYLFEFLTLLLTKKNYGVSNYAVNLPIVKLFSRKSTGYIYNFLPEQYNDQVNKTLRADLGVSNEDILVVSVARITKDKGFHILEDAILKCNELGYIKFIIVGDGPYLSEMKTNLKDLIEQKKVFLLGFRSDIQNIIKSCNIFVLPTLHETLSIALLEASVEGLPLIATRVGGISEIITDGVNGYLVKPDCAMAIKEAILKLYYNKDIRVEFGKNAKIVAYEKFNNKRIESRISDVYESLLLAKPQKS